MGKKKKGKQKREPLLKTKEERMAFYTEIDGRLKYQELNPELFSGIARLYEILNEYVLTGESATGKIPIPEISRVAEYILSCRARIKNTICLRYVGDLKEKNVSK